MNFLTDINQHLFFFANQTCANTIFDVAFLVLTWAGDKLKWLLPIWLFFLIKGPSRIRWYGLLALITLVMTDTLGTHLLKPFFAYPRPFLQLEGVRLVSEVAKLSAYGFPSNHALNSFGVAMFTSLFFSQKILSIAAFSIAALVAISRVYIGVHFPLDVMAGAALGSLVGWSVFKIYITKRS